MRKDSVMNIEISFFLIWISQFQVFFNKANSQCSTIQQRTLDCYFPRAYPIYSILEQCSQVLAKRCRQLQYKYVFLSYSACVDCRVKQPQFILNSGSDDDTNCTKLIESQTFMAEFETSSLEIQSFHVETMLRSLFINYCRYHECLGFSTPQLARPIRSYDYLSAFLLKFVFDNQMLSLSFVIFTDVGEILAIDSIKAGLYSQANLTYDNYYWIKLVPDNVKNVETKSQNVETKSQTLTIVLVCLSIGVIIFVITVIFYLRRRKMRIQSNAAIHSVPETHRTPVRELVPTHTNVLNNEMRVNNLGHPDEPPPPYEPNGYAQSYNSCNALSSESPPDYASST